MKWLAHVTPAIVALLALAWLGLRAVPPDDPASGFRINDFGVLPVVYQGRVKPLDTLARNSLVIISDRQTWRDADDERRPAIEWLLDVMAGVLRELISGFGIAAMLFRLRQFLGREGW